MASFLSFPVASARFLLFVTAAFWALALFAPEGATAATYTVGGETGWTIPTESSFYTTWAAMQTYVVGDSLVFSFTTGNHNVLQVSSLAGSCGESTAIGDAINTGPTTVTLAKAGPHYYICGFPGHCGAGQVLAINVSAATTAAPAPAPTSPSDAAPSPDTMPVEDASPPPPLEDIATPPPGGSSKPTVPKPDPSQGGGPPSSGVPSGSSSTPAAPTSSSPGATSSLALTGLVAWLAVAYAFALA